MEITKETKRTHRTWKGQAGWDQEFHLDKKALGHRITVQGWDEDGPQGEKGEVTIQRITGDFWRDPENAKKFEEIMLRDPSEEMISLTIQEMASHAE